MEYYSFKNGIQKFSEKEVNGIPVGIVEGYISTWDDVDRGYYKHT